ncbi:MAG: hypothetical protein ABEI98_06955 [Halorhabdus sp.]
MVFDKLTLFEVHLEDAAFGPNAARDRSETDDEPTVEAASSDSSGISIGRLVVASVVLSVAVSILARKLVGDEDEPEVAIDAPEETDGAVDVAVED